MNQRKPAQPPGSLIYVGDEMKHTVNIECLSFSPDSYNQVDFRNVADLPELSSDQTYWINVNGVHNVETIKEIGLRFHVPQLVLEDVLNTEHRPKIELLEQHLFVIIKMLYSQDDRIAYEHLSLILGENYVLTFQEQPRDVFDPVRKRIALPEARLRTHGADYLAYALIDAVVDNYLLVCDQVESEIEVLEEMIFVDCREETIQSLHATQRELIFLSKTFRGGREVLARLLRYESPLISQRTQLYMQDVNDHMLHAVESVEVYREIITGLDNLHFSTINQKTNDTMKLLTLYASIFMPLTFAAGIYGMNFEHMPELKWKYSYPVLLSLMLFAAVGMILFFRRKKWL